MPSILNRLLLALALAGPLATLAGCGQMGPLYRPVEEPTAEEVEEAPVDTAAPLSAADEAES